MGRNKDRDLTGNQCESSHNRPCQQCRRPYREALWRPRGYAMEAGTQPVDGRFQSRRLLASVVAAAVDGEDVEPEVAGGVAPYRVGVVGAALSVVPLDEKMRAL